MMIISKGERFYNTFNIVFLSLFSLLMLYPFWYVLIISLNDSSFGGYSKVLILPVAFTLDNYKVVFANDSLVSGYIITIIRTAAGVFLSVLFNAGLAYGLSKKRLMGRKLFLNLVIITLFFSGGLIPWYIIIKSLGLLNHFWVLIIPYLLSPWTILIMKTFFNGLSPSVEESARMDGANDLLIFFKIVIPLSAPIIATMGLYSAVFHWNDWWAGEMLISNSKLLPVQTILMRIISQQHAIDLISQTQGKIRVSALESINMAAIIITTVPILMIYPSLQKYFLKGIMLGSIKE